MGIWCWNGMMKRLVLQTKSTETDGDITDEILYKKLSQEEQEILSSQERGYMMQYENAALLWEIE